MMKYTDKELKIGQNMNSEHMKNKHYSYANYLIIKV